MFASSTTSWCGMLARAGGFLLGMALVSGSGVVGAEVDFLRDVRPILSSHCFKCHGPDEETRKGGLRLDLREDALKPAKSGKVAIVPGAPGESEVLARVLASDESDLMPPPEAKHPLNAEQKEILERWIAAGAEYTPHWAFQKPKQAARPAVEDETWPRNEIDYFILSRLEKEGLKPSERANRHTLVRRLYLDLIGLPPTPEQADAFVNDPEPNAYERLVDRLLGSPHYGERWARRWLDLARYADTNGYEKDRPRSIWPYRDWVIRAINEDMPFTQFTVEQLAGDMLPNPTVEQIIATGFNRNTMLNEEGGIDPLEYRFYAMVDRVHVTATTWLGLTMACAQCHTHKYDPIQHEEYYSFMALLNNADEPKLSLPDPEIAAERKKIAARIEQLEAELLEKFPAEVRVSWATPAEVEFASDNGAEGRLEVDGSIVVSGKNPEKDVYTLKLSSPVERVTHLLIEAIPGEGKGPGRTGHGNFVLSEVELEAQQGGEPVKAEFAWADADFSQAKFPGSNAIDGKPETGWAVGASEEKRLHRRLIITLAKPLEIEAGTPLTVRLAQNYGSRHTLGRFRLSLGSEANDPGTLAERRREHRDRKFAEWVRGEVEKVVEWTPVRPATASSETPVLTIEEDGSVFATGDFTKRDVYKLSFRDLPAGVKAIRIEALPDERLPRNGPGTVAYEGPEGDFWMSTLRASANGEAVVLQNASESYASGGNNAAKALDEDLQSGWSINGGQGKAHSAVFQLAEALEGGELELELIFERYYAAALGKFRVWVTTEEEPQASAVPNEAYAVLLQHREPEALERLLVSEDAAEERETLLRAFVQVAPELASAREEIEKLRDQMPSFPTTLVMRERAEEHTRPTFLHNRGEFLQPKQQVSPGVPEFLPPLPEGGPADRLALAKWLVSEENPLTARVTMNREWEAFFGHGLVRTMEDFGFQGELPTHPDLLDWLAVEFMKEGWSRKKMHKLIVMSATYQQASEVRPELREKDPENRLLARGPRFRVEAELVRDGALVASGLFSPEIGGPSVFPPQPAGVTTEGAYGALQWKVSEGGDRYRRGLYTFAKRTTPYAMTLTFDGPSGEACLARRDRSNTPLQALTLLNDDVFMECARALGNWAGEQGGSEGSIAAELFRRCLTRPPSEGETKRLTEFYRAQLARFQAGELDPVKLMGAESEGAAKKAAWTALARVLMNLDETITKS